MWGRSSALFVSKWLYSYLLLSFEKTLWSLNGFGPLVENQLLAMWGFFVWTLILFRWSVCPSVLRPVLHCFDYYSFVEVLKLRCESSNSVLFFFSRLFWLFRVLCIFIMNLGSACLFLQKRQLEFWYGLYESTDQFVGVLPS